MEKHKLALDIPDTLNLCVFRVIDTSIYSSMGPVECTQLHITPPGFVEPYLIENLTKGFSVNLSACDVGLQTTNCGTTANNFADGVYIVRWSVSPNNIVYVEYNILRISKALSKINDLLCCIDIKGCEPDAPLKEKLKEIQLLTTMLKAAKAKVEYCHNPGQGMDIYNYVIKRLDKLACGCGCSSCS